MDQTCLDSSSEPRSNCPQDLCCLSKDSQVSTRQCTLLPLEDDGQNSVMLELSERSTADLADHITVPKLCLHPFSPAERILASLSVLE